MNARDDGVKPSASSEARPWATIRVAVASLSLLIVLWSNAQTFDTEWIAVLLFLGGLSAYELVWRRIAAAHFLESTALARVHDPSWPVVRYVFSLTWLIIALLCIARDFDRTEYYSILLIAVVLLVVELTGRMFSDGSERTATDLESVADPGKIVRNQTASRLGIDEADRSAPGMWFVLPPFGAREVTADQFRRFDWTPWLDRNLITLEETPEETPRVKLTLYVVLIIAGFLFARLFAGMDPLATNRTLLDQNIWDVFKWVPLIGFSLLTVFKFRGWLLDLARRGYSRLRRWFNCILTALIGFALPALALTFIDTPVLESNPQAYEEYPMYGLGRVLQLVFVGVVSTLPALMYFLFDRQRLSTLRESFLRDIILLDRNVGTLSAATSMYGTRVDEVYGPHGDDGSRRRHLYGTRIPIHLATLVITIGWIFALVAVDVKPDDIEHPSQILDVLKPVPNPYNMGFLGAYFFVLTMVLRRYARSDLKPKAYSHVTVRFLIVGILVWVVEQAPTDSDLQWPFGAAVEEQTRRADGDAGSVTPAANAPSTLPGPSSPWLLTLCFAIGVVPETALSFIRERSGGLLARAFTEERYPLTDLEGISLYDRARLLEEGVENIEHLVNHDLIELMLQTRIPLQRLLDWIDQGVLYLHLHKSVASGDKTSLTVLRDFGIRTATDLQRCHQAVMSRAQTSANDEEYTRFLSVLGESSGGMSRAQLLLDVLDGEEWLDYIHHWRNEKRPQEIKDIGRYTIESNLA